MTQHFFGQMFWKQILILLLAKKLYNVTFHLVRQANWGQIWESILEIVQMQLMQLCFYSAIWGDTWKLTLKINRRRTDGQTNRGIPWGPRGPKKYQDIQGLFRYSQNIHPKWNAWKEPGNTSKGKIPGISCPTWTRVSFNSQPQKTPVGHWCYSAIWHLALGG